MAHEIVISTIAPADIDSFRTCLDAVARERKFLALLEAPPPGEVRSFVIANIANGIPQVVAREAGRVVGWCDIVPGRQHARKHCGYLGMGVLPEYRGRGLGARLLFACLHQARAFGITRVELEVREDNAHAAALYDGLGFVREGKKRNAMCVDGRYFDTIAMSLLISALRD